MDKAFPSERREVTVHGIVQGVGFRPFVYHLAKALELVGFVKNQSGTVAIEIEGDPRSLDRFLDELALHPPPRARVDEVAWRRINRLQEDRFQILASESDGSAPCIAPDVAICDDCLAELFDPADRRFRYPFLNCTHCGPRLTIITGAPYDRQRTTMARFAMCPACRREYEDPADRRFHAQPIACPQCGPQLRALDANGAVVSPAGDPIAWFVSRLRAGQIGALKGLGGYHLVCDAGNPQVVAELRRRKARDEKPLAVMVQNLERVESLCEAGSLERELLQSPRCPIVLLRKRASLPIADAVAPANPLLGVMLPYTPLHQLLLREADPMPLVMTSGNRSDEPIAYDDDDAQDRLRGIADVFLAHDRPICVRCDDSVTRVVDGAESPLRRSRGYAPEPLSIPLINAQTVLAVGGQLKATFALGWERTARVSHHLGDLDHFAAYQAFERDIALYERLFAAKPERIAHDLHPDYASTRYALERAGREGLGRLAIQHHHAHMASCMAEHGLVEPVIGVTLDGTGFGLDGAVWGGEFLVGDYRRFRRAAHLRYVGMPGGEQAIREPWRMAVSHLADAGVECRSLTDRRSRRELRVLRTMIERRLNAPLTSSAGRLFDAVAALAGVRDGVRYEGQAAVELEWLAEGVAPDAAYPFDISQETCDVETHWAVDTRPLIEAVARDVSQGVSAATIARRFHSAMTEIIVAVCERIREQTRIDAAVLSGGVFMNALLSREAASRLTAQGFRVFRHRLVPPNDGGLSLGQLAIAAAHGGPPA